MAIALIAQWIELFRPKEEMWVRFLLRAQNENNSRALRARLFLFVQDVRFDSKLGRAVFVEFW
ncbi:MAG: hypothetical protein RLZZ480_623 [Candidatus Parcubacteria bacterium]